MARYTKQDATTVPQINTELEKIELAIQDTLSRKGDTPNSMAAPLDMNSNRILNLPEPITDSEPVTKGYADDRYSVGSYLEEHVHTIESITGLKEILEELTMAANNTDLESQPGFPYQWVFPANDVQRKTMEKQANNNSIGYGGSTWWVRPMAMGRQENGIDVIYVGTTYGSPENRSLDVTGLDVNLSTNKRLGEAVISVAKVSVENQEGLNYVTFEKRGVNDKKISYREDEHHQPMIQFSNNNGQVVVSWGSRNAARTQDGSDDPRKIVHVRYGQSLDSLSASETPKASSTIDYSQSFFAGNSMFIFGRDDVGNWSYCQGAGGQSYSNFVQFLDSQTEQYYLAMSFSDTLKAGLDVTQGTNRPVLHMFAQAHPTINPDRTLRYLQGRFFATGSSSGAFNTGGIFLERPTDGTPPQGTGRLGSMEPLVKTDFETAYECPEGKSYRLLDVQYGIVPRALIAEFDFDWVHGASVPMGSTWDLKVVQFNPYSKIWSSLTIKTGLRGILGFLPTQTAIDETGTALSPLTTGIEGFTSFYAFGASFYRGKNCLDILPIIYYCDRQGVDNNTHQLHQVTLDDEYTTVSNETVLISNTDKILYRPEMTLYGNKRFLWYNSAQGWSTFNSFVAEHKWLDLTPDVPNAVPVIDIQPVNTSSANLTNATIGLNAISPGGDKLSYAWYFKNSGASEFSLASPTGQFFSVPFTATTNGREYYCVVTNSTGSVQSDTITLTVTGL